MTLKFSSSQHPSLHVKSSFHYLTCLIFILFLTFLSLQNHNSVTVYSESIYSLKKHHGKGNILGKFQKQQRLMNGRRQKDTSDIEVENAATSKISSQTQKTPDPVPEPESFISGYTPQNANPKSIALTFDDGPNRKLHPRITKILRKYSVPATFFFVANNLKKALDEGAVGEDFIKGLLRDGFLLGSHTLTHAPLDKQDRDTIKQHLEESEEIFASQMDGVRPYLFREPYNRRSSASVAELEKRGYVSINWGFDSNDWRCGPVEEQEEKELVAKMEAAKNATLSGDEQLANATVIERPKVSAGTKCVLNELQRFISGYRTSGSIVLLHEYKWTVEALETFILQALSKGYRFVSIATFMKDETKEYLWKQYGCENVTRWNEVLYETCQQFLTRKLAEGEVPECSSQAEGTFPTDPSEPAVEEKKEASSETLSTDESPNQTPTQKASSSESDFIGVSQPGKSAAEKEFISPGGSSLQEPGNSNQPEDTFTRDFTQQPRNISTASQDNSSNNLFISVIFMSFLLNCLMLIYISRKWLKAGVGKIFGNRNQNRVILRV